MEDPLLSDPRPYRGCSLRAVLLGLLLSAFMGLAIPWGDMIIKGSQMGAWWPFHLLGFPISSAFGPMWFSVFAAFLLKSAVLKYGGPTLYRRTLPFFLGLILGEIVPAGVWLVIDNFTGTSGNVLGSFLN
jgi:hypothetical protein